MPRPSYLPGGVVPRGLAREAAAEYLGVGPSLFDKLVGDGRMPSPKKLAGRYVWDIRALDKAFDALPTRDEKREEGPEFRL